MPRDWNSALGIFLKALQDSGNVDGCAVLRNLRQSIEIYDYLFYSCFLLATSALSSPQAVTVELTAIARFKLAFKSRAQLKPQYSQLNTPSDKDKEGFT
jgi:hypothetical protein